MGKLGLVLITIIAIETGTNLPSVASGDLMFGYLTKKLENRETIFDGDYIDFSVRPASLGELQFNISCEKSFVQIISLEKLKQDEREAIFRATGTRMGREFVTCRADDPSSETDLEVEVEIAVVREQTILDRLFPALVGLMVVLLNIAFGTEVTVNDLKFICLRPKPLIIAAICQFVLLPLWGLGLARAMGYEPDVALGVLMSACAPGGGNSNTAAFLVDGELPLSISMTFFSTAIAIAAMPLNIWIYSRFVSDNPHYTADTIPYMQLVGGLIVIAIPVGIGMLLISKAEKFTTRMMKYAKPVIFLLLLIFIVFAIMQSIYVFELATVATITGAIIFPIGGFLLGTIVSIMTGLRLSQTKTIAFEVGMQNSAIVVGMALVVFEQPEADLNSIMPMYILLITSWIAIPFYITHFILYKCWARYRAICKDNRMSQLSEREAFDDVQERHHAVHVDREMKSLQDGEKQTDNNDHTLLVEDKDDNKTDI